VTASWLKGTEGDQYHNMNQQDFLLRGGYMKMSFKAGVISVSAAALLTGCASTGSNFRPIVDNKGVDLNRYEVDLQECQVYAKQTANAGKSAAAGAAAGAALGLALALIGGGGYKKGASAGAGALVGGVSAGAQGETNQRNIIRTCLNGRGYKVLQ